MKQIENYNYIIGTQAFRPNYRFTDKEPVLELAERIVAWGSNSIKFYVSDDTLVDRVLAEQPSIKYVFMWYGNTGFTKGYYTEQDAADDYAAMYNYTKKLLTQYSGSGIEFYIGHWEGDWYYLSDYNFDQEKVDEGRTQAMIAWLNNRQRAVDAAKADTDYAGVQVWNYMELNRPVDAIDRGFDRLLNRVLPYAAVDFVSYSAYDSMDLPVERVKAVIDTIYAALTPKVHIEGPRVFIGEMAKNACECGFDPLRHRDTNLRIMAKYLQANVKFVLYWQMYCNETLEDGSSRGYWLVNDKNEKQPLYHSLERVLSDAKIYVKDYFAANGTVPPIEEYRAWLGMHDEFLQAENSIG